MHKMLYLWLALISLLSLAFDEAPIGQVLQALADYQQLNLVVAPGVEGNLSLRLKGVPWQQVLSLVMKMGRLTTQQHGNVLLVYPESWRNAAARRH